jgi:predicted dehydrogenase
MLVIGAGVMGSNHSRSIAHDDQCELIGIVDADGERANQVANTYNARSYPNLDQAISETNPDGVVVATTTASHLELCRELIDRKIPFLVEKPITDNLATTQELLQLSASNDLAMMCGFVERFNPAVQTALGLLTSPIRQFQSVRHSPVNPRATASVVYDLLIHDLDIALAFHKGNDEISSVGTSKWYPVGSDVDEIADCVIQFKDGAVASLSASRQGQRKIREIRVTTESQLIEVDLLRANVTIYQNVMQEVVQTEGASTYRAATVVDVPFVRHQGEPLAQQIDHFRKLIIGEVDTEKERATLLSAHILADRIISAN